MQIQPLKRFKSALFANTTNETVQHAQTSAIVFAPHQDDETLGCGGTILLKRQTGSSVRIVFMTDGTTSHSRFMDRTELCRLRNEEACLAAKALGVPRENLQFLGYPDSRLADCHQSAVTQVLALLDEHRPDEVFVPYRADGTADHEATYRIVVQAAQLANLSLRVCEYPVWYWNQWPWVPLELRANRDSINSVRHVLRSGCGVALLRKFRSGVFIVDMLEKKRLALEQHRSQMSELVSGVGWPTLNDVATGAFLKCFFQPFEVFHCWNTIQGAQSRVPMVVQP